MASDQHWGNRDTPGSESLGFGAIGVGLYPRPADNPFHLAENPFQTKQSAAPVRVQRKEPQPLPKTPRTVQRERLELEKQLEDAHRQLRPAWSGDDRPPTQDDIELQIQHIPVVHTEHHTGYTSPSVYSAADDDLEGGLVVSTRDAPLSHRAGGSYSARSSGRRTNRRYQQQQVVNRVHQKVDQNIRELESLKHRMHEGHELTVDDLLKLSPRSAYHLQAEGMAPQAARTMDLREKYAASDMADQRSKLIKRLDRRLENNFDGVCDRLANEFFITGQLWFDYFSPKELGGHAVLFTWAFFAVCTMLFSYMAGQYPYWFIRDNHSDIDGIAAMYTTDPRGMWYFLWAKSDSTQQYTFAFNYLLLWGGRWLPSINDGQWWRWLTSILLHENHNHITSNMALFLVLAYFMEQKYGTTRVTLIAVISGIGGNLFSAMFESDCMLVMGASGLIFGLFGLYITDLLVNFETIQRPVMQGICVMTLLVYFAWCAANSGRHSSDISHLGGLICGLFPSFLVIPTFKQSQDWEAVLPFVALLVIAVVFVFFPLYIYFYMLPIDCSIQ